MDREPMGEPDLSTGERAELEQLRAEVTELRSQQAHQAPQNPQAGRRRIGWRGPIAILLITVGCILAPVSVVAVWTANQVSDTGRYVANVTPLVHDPAVQNALTDKITNQITGQLNVAGLTSQAAAQLTSRGLTRVGSLLENFSSEIAGSVNGFIHSQVHRIVSGPRFERVWVQANTVAHQELVKALSGRGGGAVSVTNGQVVVGLGPFISNVKQSLSAQGFTLVNSLPTPNPTFPLFSAKYLEKAQTLYRLINDLKIVLPILTLLLIAAGIYVARRHRRALVGAGLGFAASMLVLGAGLAIFRSIYLGSVPAALPADAAAALFDTFVRFIKQGLRVLLVVGLVVALGAFLTGPSVTAVRIRSALGSGIAWIRHSGERAGLRTGPVGTWTYAHRIALRVCAVALAALVFVFWGQPTALVVIVIVLVLLVVLGLIELIGRPTVAPGVAGHP
jgi:hypothetical protein